MVPNRVMGHLLNSFIARICHICERAFRHGAHFRQRAQPYTKIGSRFPCILSLRDPKAVHSYGASQFGTQPTLKDRRPVGCTGIPSTRQERTERSSGSLHSRGRRTGIGMTRPEESLIGLARDIGVTCASLYQVTRCFGGPAASRLFRPHSGTQTKEALDFFVPKKYWPLDSRRFFV